MTTDLGSAEGMETRELVHFVTQQTRFALINNILQHPQQLPSMYELEELNPSVSEATVYKHVQKLIDAGIVEEVALEDGQRRQGYPWKFYGLTDAGRSFLKEHNLLAAEETLQQIYDTISDKPEKMVKYENAPRPDGLWRSFEMADPDRHAPEGVRQPGSPLPEESGLTLEEYLAMQRAIGHRTRFRILRTLVANDELSTSELKHAVDVEPHNFHYHLDELVDVGLVDKRQRRTADSQGFYTYYRPTAMGRGILDHGVEELMRREREFNDDYS